MKRFLSFRRSMKSPRRSGRYRPGLLVLEDRLLLSVFTVNDLGDSGTGSDTAGDLRYCLTHVARGDTVTFDVTGTIDLTRPLPTLVSDLTITGPGADSMTVERNSAGDFRIFLVGTGATVDISGLTIANGSENQGGAILNNGVLTAADDVFSANTAVISGNTPGSGGAIYNAGTLTVMDSDFETNTAASTSFNGSTGGAIDNPTGKVADISGSTFSGNATLGNRSTGGAIYNAGTLMVGTSTLSNNTSAGASGAISNDGMLTVNDSVFTSNAAGSSDGGAIGNTGTLTINGGDFESNTTTVNGGAIITTSRLMVTINASTFSGNTAGVSGGAIDNAGLFGSSGTMTVSGSTLSGNSATFGGGIASAVTLTINNSTVAGNTATGTNFNDAIGGGITDSGPLTINNSTVAGNLATATGSRMGLGGGIYYNGSDVVTLTSCTIADNTASSAGGGLYVVSGPNSPVRPRNVLLAGNTASMGPDLFGRISSQGHNLVQDPSQGIGFDSSDLLTVDPLLDPNGLQDNGGPTQTIALLSGSPAIDAGDNTGAADFDQRGDGYPRVVGIVDPSNPVIDIGAFEVQGDGTHPSSGGVKGDSIRSSNPPLGLEQALAFFQKAREKAGGVAGMELNGW